MGQTQMTMNRISAASKIINGSMAATKAVAAAYGTGQDSKLHELLARHAFGDWGDITPDTAERNDETLSMGDGAVFSMYKGIMDLSGEARDVCIVSNDPLGETETTMFFPGEN